MPDQHRQQVAEGTEQDENVERRLRAAASEDRGEEHRSRDLAGLCKVFFRDFMQRKRKQHVSP